MKNLGVIVGLMWLISCGGEAPKVETILVPSANETADMNKSWNQEEQEIINQFVARKGWKMTETQSGLKYIIYQEGTGQKATPGMKAMVEYSITLLDGSEVYSTKQNGPKPFQIEQDNVEPGLHEGITYMKVGDRAKMIIPYYLAHGLMGDHDKIPPLASLVFDIRLLGVSN